MKKLFYLFTGIILSAPSLANIFDNSSEYKDLQKFLNPKEQAIFEEVFDKSDKLIDSHEVELKFLTKSDFASLKKKDVIEEKIKELKLKKDRDLASLKEHLNEDPERHLRDTSLQYVITN